MFPLGRPSLRAAAATGPDREHPLDRPRCRRGWGDLTERPQRRSAQERQRRMKRSWRGSRRGQRSFHVRALCGAGVAAAVRRCRSRPPYRGRRTRSGDQARRRASDPWDRSLHARTGSRLIDARHDDRRGDTLEREPQSSHRTPSSGWAYQHEGNQPVNSPTEAVFGHGRGADRPAGRRRWSQPENFAPGPRRTATSTSSSRTRPTGRT